MFTEDSIIDQITAVRLEATDADDGQPAMPARWVINVRRANRVLRDGKCISREVHRHVLELDGDLSSEDPMVRAIAATLRGNQR